MNRIIILASALLTGSSLSHFEYEYHLDEKLHQKQLDQIETTEKTKALGVQFFLANHEVFEQPKIPEVKWFKQRVDHFNGLNINNYFRQRYYEVDYSDENPDAPIFLYIGGEGPLSAGALHHEKLVGKLANKLKAHLVGLEHRFYGKSMPIDSLNENALQYLSAHQALADIAKFITSKKKKINQPVIVFGCSYPGNLAAWMRLQYPYLVTGAISSSAPVQAKVDYFEYDQSTTKGLTNECAADVRSAMDAVEYMLDIDLEQTLNTFQCNDKIQSVLESEDEKISFLYILADAIAFAVQYNTPSDKEYSFINQLCKYVKGSNTKYLTPVSHEEKVVAYTDIINSFSQYVKLSYKTTGATCNDQWMTSFDENTKSRSMRSWMYQCCSNFGYWQSASADRNLSTRSSKIDVNWHLRLCDKLFPVQAQENDNRNILEESTFWPSSVDDDTNILFGGIQLSPISITNVHFTNGSVDPWMTLSITNGNKEISKENNVSYHVIEGASHCADFGTARTPELIEAQEKIESAIIKYLDDYNRKLKVKSSKNNNTLIDKIKKKVQFVF